MEAENVCKMNLRCCTYVQDAEIKLAKASGSYDDCGIIKPHGESIAFRKKEVCTTAYVLPVLSNTLLADVLQPTELMAGTHSLGSASIPAAN